MRQATVNNAVLDAALAYARAGLPVFPCKRDKKPLTSNGFKDATCDVGQISVWGEDFPGFSIGMPTGTSSGRIVIDVDPRHGGDKSLEDLQAKHGPLPNTLQSNTGGGGKHLFFCCRGTEIRNSAGILGPGLDVRGEGGYVILPPSPHPSGNPYAWVNGVTAPLDMPTWLESLLLKPPARTTSNANGSGEKIPQGQRNSRLTSYAGVLRKNGDTAEEIEAKLLAYNLAHCDPPLPESEVRTIAKSVARYEPTKAEEIPGRVPVTETSNAERLCTQHRDDLRYCSDRKVWSAWNGRFWAVNDEGAVMRRMQEVTRTIYFDAGKEADEHMRKALAAWAKQSDSRRTQENSVAIARYFEGIEVREFSGLFDHHPFLLNVANGTIDLKTGQLHPHRREDYLTKIVDIPYDPDATCPQFSKFLNETFAGRPSLIGYASRFVGCFLTGITAEQCWWLFYGPTASGKSTFVSILHGLLGPYALALPENFFLVTKNTTDFATANLAGVRFASCVETNEGRRLDVAKLKALTGEDMISAALKYQNYFQFRPQCKLVLATNHAPHVPAADSALWRRLKVVPFDVMVPEEKRIPELAKKLLKKEGPGILRWAVLGCQSWLANRLDEPAEVKAAVNEYRDAEDIVRNFLEECCLREASAQVVRKELFAEYLRWGRENGMHPMSSKKFAGELHRLGIQGDDGDRFWFGVRVGTTSTVP